ncbi:MAG: hypothetical protein A2036_00570 [Omnitrophica bacterium GWA2_50_21]|nr:MAG: hypothetical protein A2036_00570 [Omnitrophica bacterium GWA2_50_21]
MILIRPASSADDKSVKDLIMAILEKEFPAEERTFFGNDIQNVSKTYAGDGDRFFVACDGDQIVGTTGIKREDERNALLRRIFVRDDYRGKRIAFQLIQNAIEFCKKRGYDEVIFKTTSRMQNAINLCEANGFIKRATVHLGGLDLFKFTFHITENNHGHVSEKAKRRKS